MWRVSLGGGAHQGAGVRQDLPVGRPTADTSYFAISRTSSSAAERASEPWVLVQCERAHVRSERLRLVRDRRAGTRWQWHNRVGAHDRPPRLDPPPVPRTRPGEERSL